MKVVEDNVIQLPTSAKAAGVAIDQGYNCLSHMRISRNIAFAMYQVYKLAKRLGKKLETEYKSMIYGYYAIQPKRKPED